MRELTFKGFLAQYLKQLSAQNTNSLYKLAAEAAENNLRLREPLLLYAVFSEKQEVLLKAAKAPALHRHYAGLLSRYTREELAVLLEEESPELAEGYHKVWRSFQSRKNRGRADDHTKELMRKKLKRLQEQKGVTNYRIYTDLGLNPGNLNAWLKHGNSAKISLGTAREALHYIERI